MNEFVDVSVVTESDRAVLNLENLLLGQVRPAMQEVINLLVSNIKSEFTDQTLAETVEGVVEGRDVGTFGFGRADSFEIVGRVYSTWLKMIYYEQGRRPGARRPPKDAILSWIERKGITPDSPKTSVESLAFLIARKIGRDGIPGHHYFQQGLERTRDTIAQRFEDVLIESQGI